MTAPIPEEQDQPLVEADELPGEHRSELPSERDGAPSPEQEQNAETSLDEPSDDAGGE